MSACQVEKLPNGCFRVSRDFASQSAAMAAVNKIIGVCEDAFVPVAHEVPLSPAAEVQIAAAETQD